MGDYYFATVKHLPRQHDQSTHGNWATKGRVSASWKGDGQIVARKLLGKYGTLAAISKAYSGGLDRLPKGAELKLTVEDYDFNDIDIRGTVKHNNRKIAEFSRYLTKVGSKLQMDHGHFEVSEEHRGNGYGSEFFSQSEREYKKWGVNSIKLFADLQVGAYAWARLGFDFASTWDRSHVKNRVADWLQGSNLSDAVVAAATRSVRLFKYPYQFAALAVKTTSGITRYVGKEILTGERRPFWSGVKYLDKNYAPTIAAGKYLALKAGKKSFTGPQDDPEDHDDVNDDQAWINWVHENYPETLIQEVIKSDYYAPIAWGVE